MNASAPSMGAMGEQGLLGREQQASRTTRTLPRESPDPRGGIAPEVPVFLKTKTAQSAACKKRWRTTNRGCAGTQPLSSSRNETLSADPPVARVMSSDHGSSDAPRALRLQLPLVLPAYCNLLRGRHDDDSRHWRCSSSLQPLPQQLCVVQQPLDPSWMGCVWCINK